MPPPAACHDQAVRQWPPIGAVSRASAQISSTGSTPSSRKPSSTRTTRAAPPSSAASTRMKTSKRALSATAAVTASISSGPVRTATAICRSPAQPQADCLRYARQQCHRLATRAQPLLLHALTDPCRQGAQFHRPDLHRHTGFVPGLDTIYCSVMPCPVCRRSPTARCRPRPLGIGLQGLAAGIAGFAAGHAQFQQTPLGEQ